MLGICWASISSFWLSSPRFLNLPCCFRVRNVHSYLSFGWYPANHHQFWQVWQIFYQLSLLIAYIFLPPVRWPQCQTVKPMNCTCTCGCNYTAGYTWATYILCMVYISLLPLSFSPMLLFFVLIKCWVVSVWLSAKVWHGFRLAAERVSHDVPSLSSHQTPHTHRKMFHNDTIRSMKVFSLVFLFHSQLGHRISSKIRKAFQTQKTHKKCEETKQIFLYTYCNHHTVTLLLRESHDNKVWLCLIVKRCHCS